MPTSIRDIVEFLDVIRSGTRWLTAISLSCTPMHIGVYSHIRSGNHLLLPIVTRGLLTAISYQYEIERQGLKVTRPLGSTFVHMLILATLFHAVPFQTVHSAALTQRKRTYSWLYSALITMATKRIFLQATFADYSTRKGFECGHLPSRRSASFHLTKTCRLSFVTLPFLRDQHLSRFSSMKSFVGPCGAVEILCLKMAKSAQGHSKTCCFAPWTLKWYHSNWSLSFDHPVGDQVRCTASITSWLKTEVIQI